MLTALPLYFGQIEDLVGRRALIEEVHLWAGLSLPVPLALSLAGPWGARLRADIRRFCWWTRAESRWLWSLGRRSLPRPDKFNPGQKLNALFVGGSIAVMLGSGFVLKWFRFFPIEWRTGATFVHDVLAWLIFIVVAGHIGFALTHRDALRSMVRGWVSRDWAERHAAGWLEEEDAATEQPAP